MRRLAAGLAFLSLLLPQPASAADADPLRRYAPVYRYDSSERDIATAVYGRRVDGELYDWLQYWSYHDYNSQDRGVLRTGRHEGDWELVQLRLHDGRPLRAVYAQHAWAETCAWTTVRRDAGRPVVFVANGSHAALFRPGTSDRPWPDPNDEADGRGRRVVADVVRDDRVLRRPGRWGGSRAGWVPGEQSSPVSPRFQGARWDPVAFEESARPCGSGPPGRPWVWVAAVALVTIALLVAWRRTRRGTL